MKAKARKAPYRPSEKEPYMSERQLEFFRRKLLHWQADLLPRSTQRWNASKTAPTVTARRPASRLDCAGWKLARLQRFPLMLSSGMNRQSNRVASASRNLMHDSTGISTI